MGETYAEPYNANPGALARSIVVAAGAATLYGFTVYSSNAGSQFILVFDAAAIPADGAVPLYALPVAATNFVSVFYGDVGRTFIQGIVLCNSSTATTKTVGAADCFFDVQWCG